MLSIFSIPSSEGIGTVGFAADSLRRALPTNSLLTVFGRLAGLDLSTLLAISFQAVNCSLFHL